MEPEAGSDSLDLFAGLEKKPLRGLDAKLTHEDLERQTDLLAKERGEVLGRGPDTTTEPPQRDFSVMSTEMIEGRAHAGTVALGDRMTIPQVALNRREKGGHPRWCLEYRARNTRDAVERARIDGHEFNLGEVGAKPPKHLRPPLAKGR